MEPNIPESAVCLKCGYALRGLHEAMCPECGRAFDPADASTYRLGRTVIKRWRKWAEPPAGWHIYGMIILTVLVLYGTSVPWGPELLAPSYPVGCFVVLLGPFLVAAVLIDYCVRLIAIDADRARAAQDRGLGSRRRNRRFVVAPFCLALIISMFATAWPLHARFHFSRVAFERVAQQCIASDNSISGGQWIGLFHVSHVEIVGREVYFETGSSVWGAVGFVFGAKPSGVVNYIQEISPNWYTYED